MRALRSAAATLVLVLFLGLHWTALQTFAWARMLLQYSRSVPLRTAVAMTFDGRHPCAICRAIRQGRQSEPKEPLSVSREGSKLECDLPSTPASLAPRVGPPVVAVLEVHWSSRCDLPPKPRPRSLSAA